MQNSSVQIITFDKLEDARVVLWDRTQRQFLFVHQLMDPGGYVPRIIRLLLRKIRCNTLDYGQEGISEKRPFLGMKSHWYNSTLFGSNCIKECNPLMIISSSDKIFIMNECFIITYSVNQYYTLRSIEIFKIEAHIRSFLQCRLSLFVGCCFL